MKKFSELTKKTSLVDADYFPIIDSAASSEEAKNKTALMSTLNTYISGKILPTVVKYADLVNAGTQTTAGVKALDAAYGKTLTDNISTLSGTVADKLNASQGVGYNVSLRYAVGSYDGTGNPHIEIRKGGSQSSGNQNLTIAYVDAGGQSTGVNIVSKDGEIFPTLAPKVHAATETTYGGGTASNYGHVKLSDSYTSSGGAAANSVAASSKALVDAYNALDGADVKSAILAGSGSATFTIGSKSNIAIVVANRNSNQTWSVSLVSGYATAVAQVAAGTTPPVSISVNTSTKVVTVTNSTSNPTGVLFITR